MQNGGALVGTLGTCSFTGTATARGSVDVFNLSVTFQGGNCALGTATLSGIAYYDASDKQLYAAAPNSARGDAFLFLGTKP